MVKLPKSKRRSPGPFSKDRAIVRMDKRTRAGRIMRTIRADLIDHCGGVPSAAERILIESAALKATRLHLISERVINGAAFEAGESEKTISWANSLRLDLVALGLERRMKDVTPSLDDIVAEINQEAPE